MKLSELWTTNKDRTNKLMHHGVAGLYAKTDADKLILETINPTPK